MTWPPPTRSSQRTSASAARWEPTCKAATRSGATSRKCAAFPDFHNRIDELIDAGDQVIVRLTCSGTHLGELFGTEPTGQRTSYAAIAILRLSGETIEEGWVVGDTQELWRALGRL